MSNHFSADKLKFPGDDRRLDLTDVFVFQSAENPDRTVLIIDSNPTSAPPPIPAPTTGPEFHPDAVYRINIDNNGDSPSRHRLHLHLLPVPGRHPDRDSLVRHRRPGPTARAGRRMLTDSLPVSFDGTPRPVRAGPIRICAGLRSDPFFADVEGALHGFNWTGHDDFADNNVDSIALEVPNDLLGGDPVIGVWATISLRRDGELVQMDRGGHPTINPFINPDGEKNLYNSRQPADDVANYLAPWSKILEEQRLLARGGQDGRPAGAARHPLLRPHPARRLPQRPRPHRRRLQPALRLAQQRQDPPQRPQAPRRPPSPVPLPRRPQPPEARFLN